MVLKAASAESDQKMEELVKRKVCEKVGFTHSSLHDPMAELHAFVLHLTVHTLSFFSSLRR